MVAKTSPSAIHASHWLRTFSIYTKARVVSILFLGFSSGSGSMGTAAFVAYLIFIVQCLLIQLRNTRCCHHFMAFGRTFLSSLGGVIADKVDWTVFFIVTTLAALPSSVILWTMMQRFSVEFTNNKGDVDEPVT